MRGEATVLGAEMWRRGCGRGRAAAWFGEAERRWPAMRLLAGLGLRHDVPGGLRRWGCGAAGGWRPMQHEVGKRRGGASVTEAGGGV